MGYTIASRRFEDEVQAYVRAFARSLYYTKLRILSNDRHTTAQQPAIMKTFLFPILVQLLSQSELGVARVAGKRDRLPDVVNAGHVRD
jgi:hypothetical protein